MTFIGRLACLLALMGLFIQASGQAAELVEQAVHASVVAKSCGSCDEEPADSKTPAEPAHSHSGMVCQCCVGALPEAGETFFVREIASSSVLTPSEEKPREGFPSGLFIPPRLS